MNILWIPDGHEWYLFFKDALDVREIESRLGHVFKEGYQDELLHYGQEHDEGPAENGLAGGF